MILRVEGGLCNRIAAILGYRAKHGPLTVVWPLDDIVAHTPFLDVLQPLEGVTFVHDGSHDAVDYAHPKDVPEDWDMAYRELKPLVPLPTLTMPRPYDAVHIRRTDFHRMVDKYHGVRVPTTEEIRSWAHPTRPIWLATDNAQTQHEWRDRWAGRCHIWRQIPSGTEEQDEHDRRRHTGLAHAVVDLFMCVGAERFLGSTLHSTFTHTIERLRFLRAQQ